MFESDFLKKSQKVLFGIVLYNSYLNQSKSLNSLMKSGSLFPGAKPNVILYDNSEPSYDFAKVNKSIANSSGYIYFYNPANPGLPAAYNYFLKIGLEAGFEWLVILDQDTLLPENTFQIYIESALKHKINMPVHVPIIKADNVIISPSRLFFLRNFLFRRLEPGEIRLKSLTFINSGLMLNMHFVKMMKGFNEQLKLDFVDTEFSLRLQGNVDYINVLPLELSQSFSHFMDDLEASKRRYILFKSDLRVMTQICNNHKIALYINLLLHALKLSYKFKTFHFLKVILR